MTFKLKDISLNITDGVHNTVIDNPDGEYLLLSCKNIKDGEIVFGDDDRHIGKDEFLKLRKRTKLEKDDVLITTVGTIGELAIIKDDVITYEFQRSVGIIKPDKTKVYPPYLYFYLMAKEKYIKSLVKGAVQQCLFLGDIKEIEVDLPSLEEQKEKCALLEEIDRKRGANKKVLSLLEEQASLLFYKYFLDESVNNAWPTKKLLEVTEKIKEKNGNNNFKVLSAVNSGALMPSDEYFTKQVFSKDTGKYIVVDKMAFAYNPARINIGSIGLNEFDYVGCVSPVYVVFKVEKGYEYFFKYFIKSKVFKSEALVRSSGSVRQTLNYEDFGLIEIKYPPQNQVTKFNKQYCALLKKQNDCIRENTLLSSMRDSLLIKSF